MLKIQPVKYRIYRRMFNPTPAQKDVAVIVATFGAHAKDEAEFCLSMLQTQATSFTLSPTADLFGKYRYTLQKVPGTPGKDQIAALQIDDTKARRTARPLAYDLTWDTKHGKCQMIAYHKLYGSIRGEVDDTVEARQFFVRAIKRVWPNAEISKK